MYNCIKRLKILVTDDDSFDIELIKSIITEMGHNLIDVKTSDEAVSLVKTHYEKLNPFDVVFIDYMMPDMSGIELSKVLTKIDPSLFQISITADNSIETKKDLAMHIGFEAYIFKCRGTEYVRRLLDIAMSTKIKELSEERSVYSKRKKQIKNGV